MNKLIKRPVFVFISERIKTKDICDFLYENSWIKNRTDKINIHILSKEELNNYSIDTDKEAAGIYYDDICVDVIFNKDYRKVFDMEEEDIVIYSLVNRKVDNYEYNLYVTNNIGLEYNFYNIEKEYHKIAQKKSFIYHSDKGYEGYLLNVERIDDNVLELLLNNKQLKDVNNIKDAISYIFSINKYKNNSYELIDIDKDDDLYAEIGKFTKMVETNFGKLISFYEISEENADRITSFAISIKMWYLVFDKKMIIIDYGTYE